MIHGNRLPCRINLLVCLTCVIVCPIENTAPAQSIFGPAGPQRAKSTANFQDRVFIDEEGSHKYVVFVPPGYTPNRPWPTILYLHGASNRGTDGRSQLVTGLPAALRLSPESFPFLVVLPQCEDQTSSLMSGWTDDPKESHRALRILEAVEREFQVDRDHEILAGLSMGAAGAYQIAAESPERWRGIVAVSGKCPLDLAERFRNVPIWAIHAQNDPLVPIEKVAEFVETVRQAGGKITLSNVPAMEHDISPLVFTQPELVRWMQNPAGDIPSDLEWTRPKDYRSGINDEVPFIPGAEIPAAFQVRIAPDLLNALSYELEKQYGSRPLQGSSAPVRRSTQAGLRSFDVSVGGVRYSGQVDRLRLTAEPDKTLLIRIGISRVVMAVSGTQIDSLLVRAEAGPMRIVVGHRAPVWLTVRLAPQVEDRKVRLQVVNTTFEIPSNNWYVTPPAGVNAQGLPFMERRISDSIVQGVYDRKSEIEAQFRRNVPQLIQQLERELNRQISDQILVVGAIPLPMWQPRLKVWPESIDISEAGVTASLGITLAALGAPEPNFPLRMYPLRPADFPAQPGGAQLAVSSQFATAMTDLLIAGKVNRFHAADLREPAFQRFADRDFLESAIPELRRLPADAELKAEFVMNSPAIVLDGQKYSQRMNLDPKTLAGGFGLYLPSLLLVISEREAGTHEWRPFGEFDAQVARFYQAEVLRPDFKGREIRFGSVSDVAVTGQWKFAPGREIIDSTVHSDQLIWQLIKAREESDPPPGEGNFRIPDLPGSGLRLEGIHWQDGTIAIHFDRPPVMLVNQTETTLTLATRGPKSAWQTGETLLPGQTKTYRAPYLQTFWVGTSSRGAELTIPPGEVGVIRNTPTGQIEFELGEVPVRPSQETANLRR